MIESRGEVEAQAPVFLTLCLCWQQYVAVSPPPPTLSFLGLNLPLIVVWKPSKRI